MSLFGQTVNSRGKTGLFEPITLARRCIDCHALREFAADTADTVEEFLSKPTQDVAQSCNHSGRESRFRNSAMCNQGRQLTLVIGRENRCREACRSDACAITAVSNMRARGKHARDAWVEGMLPEAAHVIMEHVWVSRAHVHDNR